MSKCELALNRLLHCDKSWRAFGNTKESIKHEPQCSQMSGVFCHSNFVIWHSMRTLLLVLWLRIFYLSPISNNFSWNPHHSYFLWYHFRSMDHFAGQFGDHLRAFTDIQLNIKFSRTFEWGANNLLPRVLIGSPHFQAKSGFTFTTFSLLCIALLTLKTGQLSNKSFRYTTVNKDFCLRLPYLLLNYLFSDNYC